MCVHSNMKSFPSFMTFFLTKCGFGWKKKKTYNFLIHNEKFFNPGESKNFSLPSFLLFITALNHKTEQSRERKMNAKNVARVTDNKRHRKRRMKNWRELRENFIFCLFSFGDFEGWKRAREKMRLKHFMRRVLA